MDNQNMKESELNDKKIDVNQLNDKKLDESQLNVKKLDESQLNEKCIDNEETSNDKKLDENQLNDNKKCTNEFDLNDPGYKYTQLVYTTEIYKIQIENISKYVTHPQLKKFFINKFNLTPKKIKIVNDRNSKLNYAFVTFSNEDDRLKAIECANNFIFKNYQLKVFKALPRKDELTSNNRTNDETTKINYDEFGEDALQELLFNQVCPLWKKSYDCQLEIKKKNHFNLLDQLLNEIKRIYKNNLKDRQISNDNIKLLKLYLNQQLELKLIYNEIKSIEQFNNYRNKCEFSFDPINKTVGWRLGRYKDGIRVVKPSKNCLLLNEKMSSLLDVIEKFVKQSELEIFDLSKHDGHLKQFTIRTTTNGCMLIIELTTIKLDDLKLNNEINKLKLLIENEAKYVTSIYINIVNEKQLSNDNIRPNGLEHIYGDLYLIENMRNNELQYRISPTAFFQINKRGAELLYETIANIANLNKNVIVLDLCCGVGTIGIYLASKVKHVIGVELNKDAVIDAVHNAKLNQINNITFHQGMAEDKMPTILKEAKSIDPNCEIVAIADPPRAGFSKNCIIKMIRNCNDINSIVYVCCEPKYSRQNLIDLCRPKSKSYSNMPFTLIKAISVDLFPHTEKCELVTLFKRGSSIKQDKLNSNKESNVDCNEETSNKESNVDFKEENSNKDSNVDCNEENSKTEFKDNICEIDLVDKKEEEKDDNLDYEKESENIELIQSKESIVNELKDENIKEENKRKIDDEQMNMKKVKQMY